MSQRNRAKQINGHIPSNGDNIKGFLLLGGDGNNTSRFMYFYMLYNFLR